MRVARRAAVVVSVLAWVAALAAPPGSAISPPVIEPGPPPSGPLGPTEPTELKNICGVESRVSRDYDPTLQTSADAMIDYMGAWRFSRGAGQKVAVIDTGVNRLPRLPLLEGGGDYVSNGDGLQDCDSHGTLVAGIIGAAPSPFDTFAGVAPEATILSIRQNSNAYGPEGSGSSGQQNDPNAISAVGNVLTLAYAITRAVDLGATVINISAVGCVPVGAKLDDAALGRAVRYAYERNVVVVAAAGNVSSQGSESKCSKQNSMPDPNQALSAGWGTVQTIATPAWFADYVLTVGAVSLSAEPADFSLHGPWVSVAAPGEHIVSLNPAPKPESPTEVINTLLGQQAFELINGTSFATPFVSGTVALIRSRFPELNARQVMDLVKRTAHTPAAGPNEATGYGVVDPVAALTYWLPPGEEPDPNVGSSIPGRPRVDTGSQRARTIVLSVTGGSIALMVIASALAATRRRRELPPVEAEADTTGV